MSHDWKEPIGFLCRWCLLAAVGAVALLAGWTGVVASKGLVGELSVGVILPDGIWRSEKLDQAYLTGYLAGTSQTINTAMLMATYRGRLSLVPQDMRCIYPRMRQPAVGENVIELKGVPYGPLAYEGLRARLVRAGDEQRIFLVDGRLIRAEFERHTASARDWLLWLQRRGVVLLFHPGPLDAFARDRRRLREGGVNQPFFCSIPPEPSKAGGMHVLGHVAWTLWRRSGGQGNKQADVVTADRALAISAAGEGRARYRVHLIAGGSRVSRPRLWQNVSLLKLKESLAGLPIGQ